MPKVQRTSIYFVPRIDGKLTKSIEEIRRERACFGAESLILNQAMKIH